MMKQAIIDIGSNSMRLSVYDVDGQSFRIMFKEKIMAGLAGYVVKGSLSEEGIRCAYVGLLDFKEMIEAFGIENTSYMLPNGSYVRKMAAKKLRMSSQDHFMEVSPHRKTEYKIKRHGLIETVRQMKFFLNSRSGIMYTEEK